MAFRTEVEDFAQLYERTYQAVFRTTLGICGDPSLAADVTQDAYESAYRQQARFRGDVPAEAWLHRIAVNAALTALRRRRVRWTEPIDSIRHDRPTVAPDGTDTVAVCDAVARLDPRQRAAVVLRYYRGSFDRDDQPRWLRGGRPVDRLRRPLRGRVGVGVRAVNT